jgi:hypothetical protein
VLGAARRAADPEVELGRALEALGKQAQGGVDHRRAAAVLGEAGGARARDHAQLEGRARGPGTDQRRLVIHRYQAFFAAHLLDQDLAQQPAALGAFGVGADPLALARHRGRNEVERV